nr:MAG TPA: hypothetical protein [Caudoviricetes sp.]
MKFLHEIKNLIQFLYLKNKLDKLILNSKPFGYSEADDRIVFGKEAYGKVLADQSTTNPNIYGILHFYINEKYILLRYNFSCNLNDNTIYRYLIAKRPNLFYYKYIRRFDDPLKNAIINLYVRESSCGELKYLYCKYNKLYKVLDYIIDKLV